MKDTFSKKLLSQQKGFVMIYVRIICLWKFWSNLGTNPFDWKPLEWRINPKKFVGKSERRMLACLSIDQFLKFCFQIHSSSFHPVTSYYWPLADAPFCSWQHVSEMVDQFSVVFSLNFHLMSFRSNKTVAIYSLSRDFPFDYEFLMEIALELILEKESNLLQCIGNPNPIIFLAR